MKPTIALFIADPKCSVQSSNGIMKALGNKYTFKIFSKNELEENFFDNVDMIIVPGGFGDSNSYKNLFKHNAKRIKKFVKQGGKYLGICMGGYWAGKHYLNILDNIDTVQYIRRPNTDTRRPHAKNAKINWHGISTEMFFYDGCAVVGDGDYETIATYANGDSMAVIQKNIGIIGCHPESEAFWYDSYSWLKGKYHNGEHHKLLLEFTNRLMEK
jgi:glutamine amidotransferase PdxT